MDNFKAELKRKCDIEFSRLQAKHKPKNAKKGSLESVQNSLTAFGKLTEETSDMVTKNANELYTKLSVSKEKATEAARELIREYLEKIKKNSGF